MKKRIKQILLCLLVIVCLALVCWALWENTALEMNTTYSISGDKLPDAFDGFTIAHVSDLHNAQMGEHNEKLLQMLQTSQPDMIAITGDIVDCRRTDVDVALEFACEAVKIAPCYYVAGNHEARISQYMELEEGLAQLGVQILENECIQIQRESVQITLAGVEDPAFCGGYLTEQEQKVMQENLALLKISQDSYTVLLSHRPEYFENYVQLGADLVLSGHAHGGQFRLPFVGGLYAPGQGVLPKYDAGLFTQNATNMIVSRGIGNSMFPLRFNNPPELIVIQLQK